MRATAVLLLLAATPAAAQLRPLEPAEWYEARHTATCGLGHYRDLGAGLVGARGTLAALGDCTATVDLGRARIQLAGTLWRTFTEERAFAEPGPGVDPSLGPKRQDWGTFVLETLVPFQPEGAPWMAGLRFGTRWPTTDNTVGLGRDRTDIHAALVGGWRQGPVVAYAELGAGINGTRNERYEQQDVFIYTAMLAHHAPRRRIRLVAVGHAFGLRRWAHRGNENLGELRLGARFGGSRWVDLEVVAGYTELSPSWGVRARVGSAFGG